MQVLTETKEISSIKDNLVVGPLEMVKSRISFNGKGNILFCDSSRGTPVRLVDSLLSFVGDNALIFLSASRKPYRLKVISHNDTAFLSGHDNYFNEGLSVIVSEHAHVFLGNDCLFSRECWMRTADPHLLYDIETSQRINVSRSIFVGDHVWVGQGAFLIKGTQIGSGSIVGAKSVVSGKRIPSNTAWGGNPARLLRRGVFFLSANAHVYRAEDTEKSMLCEKKDYIYAHDPKKTIDFNDIDAKLTALPTAEEKAAYLDTFQKGTDKNRFYIGDSK